MWKCLRVCTLLLLSCFIRFLSRSGFVCCCDSFARLLLATAVLHSSFHLYFFFSAVFLLLTVARSCSLLPALHLFATSHFGTFYYILKYTFYLCERIVARHTHSTHSNRTHSSLIPSLQAIYSLYVSHSLSPCECLCYFALISFRVCLPAIFVVYSFS